MVSRSVRLARIRRAHEAIDAAKERRLHEIDAAKDEGIPNTVIAEAIGLSAEAVQKIWRRRTGER